MTLIVSVIGKYGDETIEVHEKIDALVYVADDEDPGIIVKSDVKKTVSIPSVYLDFPT
jgi:hypothetical protein